MKKEICKCTGCCSYTLKSTCSKCGETAVSPKPGKYSPEDKYGHWRRMYKKSKGL